MLSELVEFCRIKSREYPHLSEDINDLYILALAEIESGESVWNEVELAINSINELIENESN